MKRETIPIPEWQRRLEIHFLEDIHLGPKANAIAALELGAYDKFENKYVGHSRLSDSCTIFFLDTLQKANTQTPSSGTVDTYSALITIDLMMMLRRLRASALLAGNGYQGPAFSLLRDVKDKCLQLSAYFQGQVSYDALSGVDKNTSSKATKQEMRNRARKVRIAAEKSVTEQMLDFSDFTDTTHRELLDIWQDSFDRENHGSSISASSATVSWHSEHQPLYLVNTNDESLSALYMNRFYDAGWMFHRLLPNLQGDTLQFDCEWKYRWDILDHSFWMMQDGLAGIGKPIGSAIVNFIDKRFPFNTNTRFNSK